MKTIAILVKKQAVLLVLFSMFSAPLFSQRDQRDIVDFLLETEVIKKYKETRDNIQKVLTSGIVFSNLTKTDYDDLKREYLKAQMQFINGSN